MAQVREIVKGLSIDQWRFITSSAFMVNGLVNGQIKDLLVWEKNSVSNLSLFFHSQPLDTFFLGSVSSLLHLKAFAWWSDLMVEHAETFLCLYSADMDAALEVQPPDSWDSFPLFQLLNDILRMDCE